MTLRTSGLPGSGLGGGMNAVGNEFERLLWGAGRLLPARNAFGGKAGRPAIDDRLLFGLCDGWSGLEASAEIFWWLESSGCSAKSLESDPCLVGKWKAGDHIVFELVGLVVIFCSVVAIVGWESSSLADDCIVGLEEVSHGNLKLANVLVFTLLFRCCSASLTSLSEAIQEVK